MASGRRDLEKIIINNHFERFKYLEFFTILGLSEIRDSVCTFEMIQRKRSEGCYNTYSNNVTWTRGRP